MKIEKNLILWGETDKPIVMDLFYRQNQKPKPVVIFCHGYKGYKDWGAWNLMAQRFAEKGFFFVKFNFSHNGGTPDNPIDFPDLEAFAEDNYSTQLADLETVIQEVLIDEKRSAEIDKEQISLIGHSRGGGIVLLKAAENPHIKKAVSFAGVSDFGSRFPQGDELERWREKGVFYVENSRTHQKMPHHFQFYEDFIAHKKQLNIKRAVQNLRIPQLIIHAADDTSVSPREAEKLHRYNPKSELFWVEKGGHTFGTKQPWDSDELSNSLVRVTEKTMKFLNS